jgi:hypothetical protein
VVKRKVVFYILAIGIQVINFFADVLAAMENTEAAG